MKSRWLTALVAGTGLAIAGTTSAAVIDFEDLGVPFETQIQTPDGTTTSTGGFDVDSDALHIHFHNQDGFGDNGTTNAGVHGLIDVSLPGGGAFSLVSFDFEYFLEDLGEIAVSAEPSGGGSVMQVFTTDGIANIVDGPSTYETFFLGADFADIVSARIFSGEPNVASEAGFFVDNIVTGDPGRVPAPATLGLLGLALLGLEFSRRRAG